MNILSIQEEDPSNSILDPSHVAVRKSRVFNEVRLPKSGSRGGRGWKVAGEKETGVAEGVRSMKMRRREAIRVDPVVIRVQRAPRSKGFKNPLWKYFLRDINEDFSLLVFLSEDTGPIAGPVWELTVSGINIKFVGDETGNDGYGKASVKCIQTSQVVSIPTGYKRVYGKVPVKPNVLPETKFNNIRNVLLEEKQIGKHHSHEGNQNSKKERSETSQLEASSLGE
uniref:Uncharacterized protein n=1 Tax=Vespula pensylvanica TaxID=30213 RepID=A0A834UE08_VESPE|nr:hypothetical protein H0235_002690 [Vespula pensylvanica]